MKNFRKIFAFFLVIIMCLGLMAGCSDNNANGTSTNAPTTKPVVESPQNAAELVAQSVAAMKDVGGFRTKMELSFLIRMEAKLSGVEVNTSMPIDMTANIDTFDDKAHGNSKLVMEVLDEKEELFAEFYFEGDTAYSNTGRGWEVGTNADFTSVYLASDALSGLNDDVLKNATFEKVNDGYVLQVPFTALMESDGVFKESFLNMGLENFADGVSPENYLKMFENKVFSLSFDEECRLVKMTCDKFVVDLLEYLDEDYLESLYADGFDPDNLAMEYSIEMAWELFDFNKVNEADVKVPDDIRDSAVPSEDFDDAGSDAWTDMVVVLDDVRYEFPYDYAALSAAGWIPDASEDWDPEMILGSMEDAEFYLFNEKFGVGDDANAVLLATFFNESDEAKKIIDCPILCLTIAVNVADEQSEENIPSLYLAEGFGWGATAEDIVAVFGEPDMVEEDAESDVACSLFVYYSGDFSLVLYVYEELGLGCVQYAYWY